MPDPDRSSREGAEVNERRCIHCGFARGEAHPTFPGDALSWPCRESEDGYHDVRAGGSGTFALYGPDHLTGRTGRVMPNRQQGERLKYAVPICETCSEQMYPDVENGQIHYRCPEGHYHARPANLPVVPEATVKMLSGAAAGLATAVNRFVSRSRHAPFSERNLNLALAAYREALTRGD